jgi:transposase
VDDRLVATHRHEVICGPGGADVLTGRGGDRRDRGYDHDKYRRLLRHPPDHPNDRPARHRTRSGLGSVRWVVERAFAWLHAFRRLRARYERRVDIHQAMVSIACSIICLRHLRNSS